MLHAACVILPTGGAVAAVAAPSAVAIALLLLLLVLLLLPLLPLDCCGRLPDTAGPRSKRWHNKQARNS